MINPIQSTIEKNRALAHTLDLCDDTVRAEMKRFNIERTKKTKPVKMICWGDKTKSIREWSEFLGISTRAFTSRVSRYGLCEKTFTAGSIRVIGVRN
jgi:hypothetical protein